MINDVVFEMYVGALKSALMEFPRFMLVNDSTNKQIYELINSFFSPSQGKPYGYNDEMSCDNLNPTPENSMERAVSGWLTYLVNPTEKFFGLHSSDLTGEDSHFEGDVAKALSQRTETLHRIVQNAENFAVIGQSYREKVKMGVAAKTVDPDDVLIGRLNYYPFDCVAIGSSNGMITDIFGIKEELTDFQARQRFPKPWKQEEYWAQRSISGIYDSAMKTYYRYNLPVHVLRAHFKDFLMRAMSDEKAVEGLLHEILPQGPGKKVPGRALWADIWFTEEMILSIEVRKYRPIMVNKLSPPYRAGCLARGQGEKSLPLLMALTHGMETAVKAFSRTYDPPWSVVDEIERLGLDLSGDGISFKESGMDDPKPLSLQADIRGVVEYNQYLQMLFDRVMYLDVFELLNKSRMTQAEVNIRDSDDYRKLTLFLCQDQADDLNPLILNLNLLVHQRVKEDPLAGTKLRALYTSDMAYANKNSIFNRVQRHIQMVGGIAQVTAQDAPIHDATDLTDYYARNMIEAGEAEILRTSNDRATRERIRLSRQKVADQTSTGEALRVNQEVLGGIPNTAEGGGVPQGGGQPQTGV